MTSSEKLLAFLEQIDDHDDEQLAEMFPVPPRVVRMGVAAASTRVPLEHEELDDWALKAAQWCLQMRSDTAKGATIELHPATVGELTAATEPTS